MDDDDKVQNFSLQHIKNKRVINCVRGQRENQPNKHRETLIWYHKHRQNIPNAQVTNFFMVKT